MPEFIDKSVAIPQTTHKRGLGYYIMQIRGSANHENLSFMRHISCVFACTGVLTGT